MSNLDRVEGIFRRDNSDGNAAILSGKALTDAIADLDRDGARSPRG